MENKIEYVKAELGKRPKEWLDIAYRADVSRRTISNMMKSIGTPSFKTTERLYKYLKKLEREDK